MKRILIFTIFLILITTTSTFAQGQNIVETKEFSVLLPSNWGQKHDATSIQAWRKDYRSFISFKIKIIPKLQQIDFANLNLADCDSILEKLEPIIPTIYKLVDIRKVSLNGLNGIGLMYTDTVTYSYDYFFNKDNFQLKISLIGAYNTFNEDHKVFVDILNTFKFLEGTENSSL